MKMTKAEHEAYHKRELKGAIFSEYQVNELSKEDRKRLLLCYPRRLFNWLKEEKKVKVMSQKKFRKLDYLSVKVVKVEKKPKTKYVTTSWIDGKLYGFKRLKNGRFGMDEIKKEKICEGVEKGQKNWVNGENLDKIKFPVPVSYVSHTGKKYYALLLKDKENGEYKYRLLRMSQDNGESIFLSNDSLKHLIRKWNIHILKAKIVLFEED